MKITFLGTGTSQGIPILTCKCRVCKSNDLKDKRLRTSAHFQIGETSINIDAGPDFRTQMLKADIQRLDAVLLTHAHHDHVAGLDDIRAYNYSQKQSMPIYGNNLTITQIQRYFDYAFGESRYPGVPNFVLHEVDVQDFYINKIKITPIPALHAQMPILGYKIDNVAYLTDVSFLSHKSLSLLQNLEILIINGLRFEEHYSHFSIPQVLELINTIKPKKTFLTHISHTAGLHSELIEKLPNGVQPAFDNLIVEI